MASDSVAQVPAAESFRVLIVVVNYRASQLVCNLLSSLESDVVEGARICVVDNSSDDGSVEIISEYLSSGKHSYQIELISSEVNGGFSYGNNIAIRKYLTCKEFPDYVLLLNPDTVVREGAIQAMVSFLDSHERAGILGSGLEGPDGYKQCSAFRFPSVFSEMDSALRLGPVSRLLDNYRVPIIPISSEPIEVDWVAGASMMIRSSIFREIGLMDENYFLYFEETDFCFQAKNAGWECWYLPSSRVVHFVGQSTGVISGDPSRKRRPRYWFQSRQRYFIKNHGYLYCLATDIIWSICFLVAELRIAVQRKESRTPKSLFFDFWRHSYFVNFLRGRDKYENSHSSRSDS